MMINKERLLTAVAVALAVGTVIVTSMNAYSVYEYKTRPPAMPIGVVSDWQSYASTGHRLGASDPLITVVVFSDYECAACSLFAKQMDQVLAKSPESVSIVIRHFPIEGHDLALPASEAAVCAAEQGRFLNYHRVLFNKPELLEKKPWSDFAVEAGVRNITAFLDCLQAERTKATVERDLMAGRRLGIEGTPTFLVNGTQYTGAARLQQIVDFHLKQIK
jgi:protein-disulfide isomerase